MERWAVTEKELATIADRMNPANAYRLELVGEYENIPNANQLMEQLAPFAFHIKLIDHSHQKENIWENEGKGNLLGAFLQAMKARRSEYPPEDWERALRLGAAAIHGEKGVPQ